MAKHKIGAEIVLEGEKAYRQAMKEIKSAHTELRSEMKLAEASFKGQQNSLDALQKKHEILSKQVEVQADKVKILEKAVADSAEKEEKAAEKVNSLSKALSDAEKEMSEMEQNSDSTAESIKEQSEKIAELKERLKTAADGYSKAQDKTVSYQTSLNFAQATLEDMNSELNSTEAHLREAEQSTDKCATSIDEYGREVTEASDKTSVFGDVLKANLLSSAILEGIKRLAEGIKDIALSAIDSGSSFEAGMSQVQAVSGASGNELERLKNKAKEMGAQTKFSATESAEALNYMAMAGWKTEDMLGGLSGIMNLAAASGEDLATTSDIVTDALTAFGMSAEESTHFADILAAASSNANTNVSMMGETFKYVAPVAGAMGYSAEDAAVAIGLMANSSIKGSQAGTSLRSILTRLAKPTNDSEMAMKALGLSITDNAGRMKPLNEVILDMRDAFAGLSENQKASYAAMLGGQEAMSGLLAIVNASDADFEKLSNAIAGCNGAAEQMAGIMQDNLKGKITLLQSALEGLGISAYEIFDDELKASVESAADAVGRLQRSMDNGDLGASMRKFSKSLGELIEDAIDFGEDALPVVIDGFAWILDNSDMIISGVAGITAAHLTMKTVVPAIEMASAAWKTYKTTSDMAAAAQQALNIAMSSNTVGLLVTAITGVTAAVGTYILMNKDNLVAIDETTEKTRELVEETSALNDAYIESAEGRRNAKNEMEAGATVCRNLADELEYLQNKTSLTASEQARQNAIIGQLNKAMPELNLCIDEQTGKLNMSTKALSDNIEALMRQGKIREAQEDLVKIEEELYEADKQRIKLKQQEEEQLKRVEKAQREYNERLAEAKERYGEYAEAYGTAGGAMMAPLKKALNDAQSAYDDLESEINAIDATMEEFSNEYAETTKYIKVTEAIDGLVSAVQGLGDAAETSGDQMTWMSEEMQEAYAEMYDNVAGALDSQMDLFSKFEEGTAVSAEQVLANMQSQIDGVTNWAENIDALAKRHIDEGLLKTLSEMGPKGAGYVSAFVEMSDEQFEKANELYSNAMTLKTETVSEITQNWLDAGTDAVTGFSDGIIEGIEDVTKAGADVAQGVLDKMKETLDEHSPSRKTKEIAEEADAGLGQGFESKKDYVLDIVEGIVSEVILTMQDGFRAPVFVDIGKGIMDDMASGINSGKAGVIAAISGAIGSIVESAKSELDTKADELSKYAEESAAEVERGAKGKGSSMGGSSKSMSAYSTSEAQMYLQSPKDIVRAAQSMQNAVLQGRDQSTGETIENLTVTVGFRDDFAEKLLDIVAKENDIYRKSTGEGRI